MRDLIKKHASSLAEILSQPSDLNHDLDQARNALIEELTGDPYQAKILSLFNEIVDQPGFRRLKDETGVECWNGDPGSVEPSDYPTTTTVREIRYVDQAVEVSFLDQRIVRRAVDVPENIGEYAVFVECYHPIDAVPRYDAEKIVSENWSASTFKSKTLRFAGEPKETNNYYIVDTSKGEIVKKLGARDFRGLTEEDLP
jgi:hypothetical protein